jgi:hypothetical protein
MTSHGHGEFEYLDWFQDRAQPLHQTIIDRFVIAGESIGVLENDLLAIGEQRVADVVVDRTVDVFSDRLLRSRRKSPLQSNGARIHVGDEESDELSLSYR